MSTQQTLSQSAIKRREDALLYQCCSQDLPPERLEQIRAVARTPALDWSSVFTLAHMHGVAPLVYQNLQRCSEVSAAIPAEVAHRFKLATYQNALAKQRQCDHLVHGLAYLHANEIDAMVFKGMALDLMVYDQPWYTVAQDIDLVLRPRRARWWQEGKNELQAELHGLGIEYELNVHHDMTLNGALSLDFAEIWCNARPSTFAGYPLYVMAPEDLLLATCINSCRKRYFRLRSLCDIVETVKRFPELDWTKFTHRAIAYKCNNIVYTAFMVATATITSPVPRHVLDDLAVGTVRRSIIDKTVRFLVSSLPLTSLSYFTGSQWGKRKIGWSLMLPYLTYRWHQTGGKIHESVKDYFASRS